MSKAYEMVVGLEVHVELKTKTKIFCSCPTGFGAEPNTQCCPVCAGMPGVLPVLNEKVVEYAIKAGLATNCAIARRSKSDRKNYFYPDLPKAYQISQYDLPLCENGYVDISTEAGEKRVRIARIHIEEDAGKLVHDEKRGTLIDLNRCGVPLIEIVSEPDMRSAEEAVAYLKKLRSIVLYTGISDAKMNEGSLRCDVNISVREKGAEKLGTRAEIKNLNSFAFVVKAIECEFRRQTEALEAGETIAQETRRFDPASGKTFSMRSKENADDYRYFPDPDLLPVVTDDAKLSRIAAEIPALPDARKKVYMEQYGLSAYHSERLVLESAVSDFFDKAARLTQYRQVLASLMLSEVFKLMNGTESAEIALTPAQLAAVADMLGASRVNAGGAKKLVGALWGTDADPEELVAQLELEQICDRAVLGEIARRAVVENPDSARDYQNGKPAALKALMGLAMAATKGRANPEILQEMLLREIGA
ncbi:MAG TPA: Asp-tRNA(Asn)/Glu-tRNA(Gln) amidotransferase subunit GatB [Clostridia bacterium]|nr:Asp-tRNA(Asn)/Glu-tRNA(Gln) amidotransferase subunit GatB [Clostridia bacterium]